ncbi:uncharacterized protein LOC132696799 [Cylas formicarius]|uniref:uncharacterized protein LOC132696799 n=1 Tax=Cylas formicarius TaxID=197179 RepID=UPI0029588096|nr:uncharacterized protein LOC132696799 [Cylas formicarius]
MIFSGYFYIVFATIFGFTAGTIPEYIHVCHRNDPDVAKCIQNSIEALRPKLVHGIPELSVPGIDPFKLDKIVIFDGSDSNQLTASLNNVEVRNAGNFEITKLKLDLDKRIYRVGVRFDLLDMEGDYSVHARILVAPIDGDGKFYANATDVEGNVIIQSSLENNYLRFKSIDFKIKIGDYNVRLENLFKGDPILSQAANQLINTNKNELIQLSIPFIERKCSEIFLQLSNKITENLKYDELFPV